MAEIVGEKGNFQRASEEYSRTGRSWASRSFGLKKRKKGAEG
ncbi:hypothetical protein RBB78_12820 [Tunturiibacter empetritectus]